MSKMTDFVYQYLKTALWSSNNWDDMVNNNPEPFDKDYSPEDFSLDAIKKANDDCDKFVQNVGTLLQMTGQNDWTQHAHDFWLTRNGHGTGFWDRGYPGNVGQMLTEAAKSFGEINPFINDNGQIDWQ